MKKLFTEREWSGNSIYCFVPTCVAGFVGFAVDVGVLLHEQRVVQTASDSAALGEAAEINFNDVTTAAQADAAQKWFCKRDIRNCCGSLGIRFLCLLLQDVSEIDFLINKAYSDRVAVYPSERYMLLVLERLDWERFVTGGKTMKIPDSRSQKTSALTRKIRSFHDSDTQGAALVEMVLVLPIILLIMTGIFSFSIALYQKLELAEAVSNGGRVLAVDRGDTDPCSTAAAAIYAAAPTLSQSKFTLTFVLNGVSTGASCAGPGGGVNTNMSTGGNAEVTASYPCVIGVYNFSSPNCTLTSQLTEVIQ